MIDWLTVVITALHKPVNGGRVISLDQEGEILWDIDKRLEVEGSYSSKVVVRTIESYGGVGLKLWISGNPSKYFQGHNLFGSHDLPKLARAFVLDVVGKLGIELRPEDRELVNLGMYQLTRVDCTGMFDLPSREDVRAWIREASKVMKGKYQSAKLHSSEQTVYLGQESRRVSLKAYCKADELDKRPLPGDLPHQDHENLLRFAENKLRVEVTFRSMWLKRRGLETVMHWGYNTASDLLRERLGAVNLPENVPLVNQDQDLEHLPPRLRAVYKLWAQGEDLRNLYPKRTYYRYRAELLKEGIDLNSPPRKAETSNVVPMWRYLVAEPAGVPEWALGTPLYFDPSRPLRALK